MELMNTERAPLVQIKDGEAFANSRDVAAFFGKNHRHVLEAVDNLTKNEPDLGLRNFRQTPYIEPQNGQSYRSIDMDRTGFMLLAMGFTGKKALNWKMRYIEAFNVMEAELRERQKSGPLIDVNDPTQLRGLLLSYADKAEQLTKRVDELIPDQKALKRIAVADGSLCVTDAAKALQIRRKDLFGYLRQNGWVYRRPGTAQDIGYQDKVQSGYLEHKVTTLINHAEGTERVFEQVRVTARGLTKLAQIVPGATDG